MIFFMAMLHEGYGDSSSICIVSLVLRSSCHVLVPVLVLAQLKAYFKSLVTLTLIWLSLFHDLRVLT